MSSRQEDISRWIDEVACYLPHQAPLKDFVYHNPLESFMDLGFHQANSHYSGVMGVRTYPSIEIFKKKYEEGLISQKSLQWAWKKNGQLYPFEFLFDFNLRPTKKLVGRVRRELSKKLKVDLDHWVYPRLFRVLSHSLDQGVSPIWLIDSSLTFLENIEKLAESFPGTLFLQKEGLALKLLKEKRTLAELYAYLVDIDLTKAYLFDQACSHPGWSGMVYSIEKFHLSTQRRSLEIHLEDILYLETLMEIDALSYLLEDWKVIGREDLPLLLQYQLQKGDAKDVKMTAEYSFWHQVWQEAMERELHQTALDSIHASIKTGPKVKPKYDFQAIFCIDDREESIRRHVESVSEKIETFSTPGFFGIEFYYQDKAEKYMNKLCPPPVTPKYLLRGERKDKFQVSPHLSHVGEDPIWGPLWVPLLGFSSGLKMMTSLFRPRLHTARTSVFNHTHQDNRLEIYFNGEVTPEGLQVGFRMEELVERIQRTLRAMNLTENFAPLVYVIGHGASSTNNPYYAAYDCGACSGRPGAINARVFCEVINNPEVRHRLKQAGIDIPMDTVFIPGAHDTTTDQIAYYFSDLEHRTFLRQHQNFVSLMEQALRNNAIERARKLPPFYKKVLPHKIHQLIQQRSENLFETRPELDHSNNCFCIIGSREHYTNIFFDRRAFLNSYSSEKDPDGSILESILSAAFPVCGGINLQYYYSKVDNQRMGAASKLPHNVVGLIGVSNGVEGDLRPGLAAQMVELHEPLRLMVVIEASPELILSVLNRRPDLKKWVDGEWVLLSCCDPKTARVYDYDKGGFVESELYHPHTVDMELLLKELPEQDTPISMIGDKRV